MLRVEGLDVRIEGAQVLRGACLDLPAGTMAGLVGRNGAGKTTLMRAVMGLVQPSRGRVAIGNRDATALPSHLRAKLGVGYMPEDRRLVPELTVQENILLPAWANDISGAEARLAWIYALMPEVEGFSSRRALQLSGGQQKLAALARALLNGEHLMLLDEPFEGIAPALAHRLGKVLRRLKAQGPAVLVSESDYRRCAGLVDKVFVIERGVVSKRAVAEV
jgi:branched-chain amino acid transport system ATP-binding protein